MDLPTENCTPVSPNLRLLWHIVGPLTVSVTLNPLGKKLPKGWILHRPRQPFTYIRLSLGSISRRLGGQQRTLRLFDELSQNDPMLSSRSSEFSYLTVTAFPTFCTFWLSLLIFFLVLIARPAHDQIVIDGCSFGPILRHCSIQ